MIVCHKLYISTTYQNVKERQNTGVPINLRSTVTLSSFTCTAGFTKLIDGFNESGGEIHMCTLKETNPQLNKYFKLILKENVTRFKNSYNIFFLCLRTFQSVLLTHTAPS